MAVRYPAGDLKLNSSPDLFDAAEVKPSNGYATTEETIKAIEDAFKNDPRLQTSLLLYGVKRIRFFFRNNRIGHITEKDIVQEVLTKFITGERRWNRNTSPDIKNQIIMAILSYIRNEYKKSKNQIRFTDYPDEDLNDKDIQGTYYNDENFTDESLITDTESFIRKCLEKLEESDDVKAYFVLQEMIKFPNSNIKIAENLDITVDDVTKAKKRIKRTAKKIIADSVSR